MPPTIGNIYVGDAQTFSGAFVNASGAPADPSTVVLLITKGDQSKVSYTYLSGDQVIVKDSTGNYHAIVLCDVAGVWTYAWEGTGAVAKYTPDFFYVNKQPTS